MTRRPPTVRIDSVRALKILIALTVANGLVCTIAPLLVVTDHHAADAGGRVVYWMALAALALTPLQVVALGIVIRTGVTTLLRNRRTRLRVHDVITHRRLTIAFQPIIELATGHVLGVEALSRFPTNEAPPDVWFAAAEQIGRGAELELLAVDSALEAAAQLPASLYVAINVSPRTLHDPRLLASVQNGPIAADRVVIEVIEHLPIDDYATASAPIASLREHGVRLAVDDAGSGYSSLRHIVALAPDIIKLDRSFIAGVTNDKARQTMVTSMVLYALEAAATLIAEGVETRAELETLAALAVDGAQGYLIHTPTTDPADWQRWAAPIERPSMRDPTPVGSRTGNARR